MISGCATTGITARVEDAAASAIGVESAIIYDAEDGRASDRAVGEVLTPPDALRRALGTNSDVQAALSRVRIAEAEANQTRLLPNPILTLAFRFPEGGGSPVIEASLAADLLSILQRPGRIEAVDYRLRAASAQAVVKVLDVAAEVQEQYAVVQSLETSMPTLEERRDLIGRLQDLARARLKAGEGSRLDTVTLDAQRVEVESEIGDVMLELAEQRLRLARLIGQPSFPTIWRLSPWQAPARATAHEGDWVAAAQVNRPELQQRRWDLAALGVDVRLTRLGFLDGAAVGVNSERDAEWTLGPAAVLPLPLFDWGQARHQRAKALRSEAQHLLMQSQRIVIEEVRRAYLAFEQSFRELQRVRTQLIPLQKQRRELAEGAFRAGQTDVTTVILAEQDLSAARARAVTLERRTLVAQVRLQRAVGGPAVAERLNVAGAATRPTTIPAMTATMPSAPAKSE